MALATGVCLACMRTLLTILNAIRLTTLVNTEGRRAMSRRLLAAIACVAFTSGCGHEGTTFVPTTSPPPVAVPLVPFAFSPTYTQIAVGDVVSRHVTTTTDPECLDGSHYLCQYFRIAVPTNGTLKIVFKATAGEKGQGVDLSLADSTGSMSWDPVVTSVLANTTYEIAIWYVTPGATFEFQTFLEAK
jgi:hypothetical protein